MKVRAASDRAGTRGARSRSEPQTALGLRVFAAGGAFDSE